MGSSLDNLKTDIEVQHNDTVQNMVLQLKGYSISNLQVITGKMFGNKTLKVFYLFSLTLLKNQRVIKIVKTKHGKTVCIAISISLSNNPRVKLLSTKNVYIKHKKSAMTGLDKVLLFNYI